MEAFRVAAPEPKADVQSARALMVVGIVLLVGLLAGAVALWWAGGQRRADNVASFARAPAGCETTLEFERTGRFTVYVETSGRMDALPGACGAPLEYAGEPDGVPGPQLVLVDADGDAVDLDPADQRSYDIDGFVGSAFRSLDITTPGGHVITVESAAAPFAVAIGGSVDDGVAQLRSAAVASAIAALLLGGLCLVLGARRSDAAPASTGTWIPADASWPSSPPGFPSPPPTTGARGPAAPAVPASDNATPPPRQPWGPPGSSPPTS